MNFRLMHEKTIRWFQHISRSEQSWWDIEAHEEGSGVEVFVSFQVRGKERVHIGNVRISETAERSIIDAGKSLIRAFQKGVGTERSGMKDVYGLLREEGR